jgi:hypothetical protein
MLIIPTPLSILAVLILGSAVPKIVHAYALEGPKWPNGSNPTVQLELGSAGRTFSKVSSPRTKPIADPFNSAQADP